jgi:hypothetical protein
MMSTLLLTTSLLLLLLSAYYNRVECFPLHTVVTTTKTTRRTTTTQQQQQQQQQQRKSNPLLSSKEENERNDDDDDTPPLAWDSNIDYDKEWPVDKSTTTPDPSTGWDALPKIPDSVDINKLGIDLTVDLEPLTDEQAKQLKNDASDVINKAIDAGIEDIERLRIKMNREIEASKKTMQFQSELEAKEQSSRLMNKIDAMTKDFLSSTENSRTSTKMAASASQAMENTGKGIEMGTWGVLKGNTVLASSGVVTTDTLLGSVENAKQKQQQKETAIPTPTSSSSSPSPSQQENSRIVLIADTKSVSDRQVDW